MKQSDWFLIENDVKKDLFFPMLRFFNIKSIEKQIEYGARQIKYYWLNNPHRFEYREILKVTPYCNFNFINFPFDFHECQLVFGSDALSTKYGFELSKPFITYKGKTAELYAKFLFANF